MVKAEVYMPILGYVRNHIIANSVIVFLVLVIVTLRVIGRSMGPGLGWDDAFVLIATPLGVAMLVCQGLFAPVGNGYSLPEHPELAMNIPFILQLVFGMQLGYTLLLAATKASMLFFYLRVFVNPWVQRASQITLGVIALWTIAYLCACIFLCKPVSAQWTGAGTCGEYIPMIQSLIGTNALGDVVIMLLPMHSVWNLKMRKTDKLGITASFGLGIACVVCAIFRLVYLSTVDLTNNVTGTMPPTVFLFTLEPNLAILCISIPMLRPFYVLYRKHMGGSRLKESEDRTSGFRSHANELSGSGNMGSMARGNDGWEMGNYYPRSKGAHRNSVSAVDNDGSDSEKNLTASPPKNNGDIFVKTDWVVSRD
ncbi:uncharacterized protein F5Z01DRAFT_622403 [Emericellopsis atlantica]|uniref:Rhodopsin domain-containing protein n=1 Tax=Emericellopsis atlantica TaxID=2614577 RepID=A0A9P7ZLL7_9HYPO|nr:uncharacterized protein F5Z01DRAFT_622403 [Emericellopsis atlantica]KAG9254359.1 hypothetical protein F5Z01DRAFT_622403 [Emericellopsis atlantica]